MSVDMTVTEMISGAADGYSEAERRVAATIVGNLDDLPALSVRRIAELSGTSIGSVSRFVRRAGFKSISELRVRAAAERANSLTGIVASRGIDADDVAGSMGYILETCIDGLRATVALMDPTQMARAVAMVAAADQVLLVGAGNSLAICANLALKLRQIAVRCTCPATTESMTLASVSLRPSDLVLIICPVSHSEALDTIIGNARDAHAPTLMITTCASSSLARGCDCVLGAAVDGGGSANRQFSTHLTTVFIVEMFFSLVMEAMRPEA